jgi:methionyl aminopeptidase
MTIENDKDMQGLLRIGQICGLTLQHMLEYVEPGITTAQLDAIGAEYMKRHGARSAPILAYRYPGNTCISINDEVAHGIPGERVIQPGDVVNVDVSAELEGYWGDTGATVLVPPTTPEHERLCRFTRQALNDAIQVARAGRPMNVIGKAVERVARRGGYRIIHELNGHGVGRHIHEAPSVFNFNNRHDRTRLAEGMAFTIEPFLTLGDGHIFTDTDGWTLRTRDSSVAAQYEHTVVITRDQPILVTKVA